MNPIFIFYIVYQLTASYGVETVNKEIYAEIRSSALLLCEISKENFTQSWRKGLNVLTQGLEINTRIRGYERLKVIIDKTFYNLKINNITVDDFETYWCETQRVDSITAEGTNLIQLVTSTYNFSADSTTEEWKGDSFTSPISATSITQTNADTEAWKGDSFTSPISATSITQTNADTGKDIGQSFYYGLFATGFVVLCLSVCCNCFLNKFRVAIARRKERHLDDNENEDVLQGNDANNDTENDTALSENDNVFSHYETINESGMIEMFHPTTSQNLPNLTWASNIVQSSQQNNTYLEVIEADSMYLDVIEDTDNQKLDPRIKLNGDEDHVSIISSSQRGDKNTSTLVFFTKNCEVDKGNTINKESPVTIETNNVEDCHTSIDSTSASSSSSELSAGERILERDKNACENPSQYMSLNRNDMEYLNSYSSPITENKLRESESQNSNNSESPGTNIL